MVVLSFQSVPRTTFSFQNIGCRLLTDVKHKKQTSKEKLNIPFKGMDVVFQITRTQSGNLPVYIRYIHAGKECTTVIRRVFGDLEVFKKEVSLICESPVKERIGRIEVKGLHSMKIKQWLGTLGF